jgi:ATP-binding cassette subfamily C protein CydCD
MEKSGRAPLWLGAVIGAGVVNSGLAIGIAWMLSRVLADAVQHQVSLSVVAPVLIAVAALAVGRGAAMWLAECAGHAGAREVISSLRARLLHALADRGPAMVEGQHTGAITMAATAGLDGLEVYFARYLPQMVLGTVIPVMVLVFLLTADPLSAVVVLVTLPLIPIFMWLIGAAAQQRIAARWALLQRLAAHFLDVVAGLPTLRIFGRAEIQIDRVREATEASRRATMGTLSIAFLSSLVLESLASISTALVAAEIGLRLVDGTMTLQTGFAVLIVVPETYMPLRQLGTFYHASKEGLAAAETITTLIAPASEPTATPVLPRTTVPVPLAASTITLLEVTCRYGDRREGLTSPVSFSLRPQTTTLVCGPSGAGKSTLLSLLVPFRPCSCGSITVDGAEIRDLDLAEWRRQTGWVSQRPSLFAGTVLDNLRIGAPNASEAEAAAVLARLFPDNTISPATRLTEDGDGISGGERVRIALARCLLRSPALLLLDEPTAFLDPRSASAVVTLLAEISATTTLVIATHEPERFPWAEAIVDLGVAAGDAGRLRRLDLVLGTRAGV